MLDGTRITGLSVEHRVNPVGIDTPAPRLSWRMESAQRGQRQTAYQVLVATSFARLRAGAADMWDSGVVRSSESVAVVYRGAPLQPSTRYLWTLRVWDKGGRAVQDRPPLGFFETALIGARHWDGACWISMAGKPPNSPGAPMLRRQVTLSGDGVQAARLYVSALGVYEAFANGRRVGVPQGSGMTVELLAPGWTNYDRTVNYMTYDVTGLVAGRREVTVGAVLGNGWYNGRISAGARYYSSEGHRLALKAKLLIGFGDGSWQVVVTRPGDGWKATDAGPYLHDDIYDGQVYDARRELPAWADGGFDDSGWGPVEENDFAARFPASRLVAYPGETARLMPQWDRRPQSITVYGAVTGEDASANGKGRIVVDAARSVSDPATAATAAVTIGSGETAIFDLGQNMVGVARYTVSGPPGARVEISFGEMLNDASACADGPAGSLYRANLGPARATSVYVLKGDPNGEMHEDSLTFYGFRYASATVTTPASAVTISEFTGRVATSAIRPVGDVRTDDPLVNQLVSNIRWGQRGNYLWIPTDCPQRAERLGWTGDAQVFAATALYNEDAVNFLAHFTDAMAESQESYGDDGAQFTETSPGRAGSFRGTGLSGWADAGVVVPWTVWQMSGDKTIVERSWPAMTRYMQWILAKTGESYSGQGAVFGDWLAFQKTSTQLISDAYYAYAALLMADMAAGTGRDADARAYRHLFDNIKRAFIARHLRTDAATGRLTVKSGEGHVSLVEIWSSRGFEGAKTPEDDSQTALLWVLKLGLYDSDQQRRQLVALLADNIANTDAFRASHPASSRRQYAQDTLSVGFLGVNVLAPVLTDHGHADLAYTLLHQDAVPSWLFAVNNGATTIWERWNAYSKQHGFGGSGTNSFNHYAYGAIAEWMYEYMAGIAKDPANPGFKHFFLQPHPDPTGTITAVAAWHDSPYGRIVSKWSLERSTLRYTATVPPNSTATLRIPAAGRAAVRLGAQPLDGEPGVTLLSFADGIVSYRLEPGTYELTSTPAVTVRA